jgi:hypothetical protein
MIPYENANDAVARAIMLQKIDRTWDALDLCLQVTTREPEHFQAWNTLGNIYTDMNRWDDAVTAYRRALAIKPDSKQVMLNYGVVEHESGLTAAGEQRLSGALEVHPGDTVLRWNRSLLRLNQGNFKEGWEDYESRWDGAPELGFKKRPHRQPLWDGTPTDAVVLVWGEQGAGDEIIYSDMINDLRIRQSRIIVECNHRLLPLFQRTWPHNVIVASHQQPHPVTKLAAYQISLASLGKFYRNRMSAFPARRPTLEVDSRKVAGCRRVLGEGPVIGISWQSKNPKIEHLKSVPLPLMAKALAPLGVMLLDVQYGDTDDARLELKMDHGIDLYHVMNLDMFEDMDGLAALMKCCDAVVTVSNTTAHLAAAVGVPTYVLVPNGHGHLWYWLKDHVGSPWYPGNLKTYRPERPGEWEPVLRNVAREVAADIERSRMKGATIGAEGVTAVDYGWKAPVLP